jgi:predicted house-cleaning noncanonical NTP pyrophosphatase (MazG superfamily)
MKNKIICNKLIRDKIPQIIQKSGLKSKISKLNNKQYDSSLKEKLLEESMEVKKAKNKAEILNELSDIMEVTNSIAKNYHITIEEVEKHRRKKLAERGGFDKRLFLKYTYKN